MPLDRKTVAHIATLARIKVPEGDLDAMRIDNPKFHDEK